VLEELLETSKHGFYARCTRTSCWNLFDPSRYYYTDRSSTCSLSENCGCRASYAEATDVPCIFMISLEHPILSPPFPTIKHLQSIFATPTADVDCGILPVDEQVVRANNDHVLLAPSFLEKAIVL
jgi:hypothetical protein